MPFFNKNIFKDENVWIWQITESAEELLTLINSPQISQHVATIKNNSRIQQYLASRILIHKVIGTLDFDKTEHGKPFVTEQNVHFSITHDKQFAGIIADNKPCGIDIQEITPKTIRIKDKYVNEQDAFSDSTDIEKLTMLWCAKEALYKLHGKPEIFFKEHMVISKTQDPFLLEGRITHENFVGIYLLKVRKIENYYLVYTLKRPD